MTTTETITEATIREGLTPEQLQFRLEMLDRVAEAHAAIKAATAGHQAGQPYHLTLQQFAAWLGIKLPEPERDPTGEPTHDALRAARAALWGGIAAREAGRWFADSGRCPSELTMNSGDGRMLWEYVTTSGTNLYAIDWREECEGWPAYTVTIPPERDQPGRYAWAMVRLAVAGFSEADVVSVEPPGGQLPLMCQAVATWLQCDLLELRDA